VRAWLSTQSRWDDLREYEEDIDLEDLFIGMILETKADLESLYAFFQLPDAADLPDVEKVRQKQAVFDAFRERFAQAQSKHERLNAYAAWVDQPLNNARLSAVDTYYQWVPMFEKILADAEGNWEAYYGSVKSLDDAGSRPGLADDL
jgi:predicted aminopeptidase